MDLETARYLLAPEGRALIAAAEDLLQGGSDTARGVLGLQKRAGSSALASAAWTIADGRRRARAKFGDLARHLYTVPEALEQATGSRAAAYHAARFAETGFEEITDLTGGIGGDALAFAAAGLRVTLVERDPVRALFAAENARAAGLGDRIAVVEADAAGFEVRTQAVWLDPARRVDSRRVIDPEAYSPPLSLIGRLARQGVAGVGVKLAPAVDAGSVSRYEGSLEYLSDAGECKEALLWIGALRRPEPVSAVMVTGAGALRMPEPTSSGTGYPLAGGVGGGLFLYEPDPAVIRAGLVEHLGAELDAAPVDPRIAYLLGSRLVETPWADAFEVVERMPYRIKNLQRALNALGVGRVIVKKRGVPVEPEEVVRHLKLSGNDEMTLVLTQIGLQRVVFLCRRVRVLV